MTLDNRQHPRFALDVDCTIVALGATLHARTRNLSRSGVSCVVPEPLSTGTEVVMEMALSFSEDRYSEPIRLGAEIMWCTRMAAGADGSERWQVGARFAAMGAAMEELLDVFIQFLQGVDEG